MQLDVRNVAKLLNVSEDTVYTWIRERALPAHRMQGQYRFDRVELQEWVAKNNFRISPELFAAASASTECHVSDAIARGGVHHAVPGAERDQVLRAVTALPGIPDSADRELLAELLLAREGLASTGLGEGIAIPHPRDPLVVDVDEPRILLCFLAHPVDFAALDGEPVRVLFVLLSPNVRAHLRLLSKLAFALHDPELRKLLAARAGEEALLARLRAIEAEPPHVAGNGTR